MENTVVKTEKKKFNFKAFMQLHGLEVASYGGFILCLLLVTILPPILNPRFTTFWTLPRLKSFVIKVTPLLILGIGATFVYSMGAIDISVGYQVAVYGYLYVFFANKTGNLVIPFLIIIVIAAICAVFNAIIGAYVKLPTVMSSVILMQVFSALSTIIADHYGDYNIPLVDNLAQSLQWASGTGNTTLTIIACIMGMALISSYILIFTKIGKRARALGANKLAAQQAGAKLLLTRIACFIAFSVFICLCSFFSIAPKGAVGLTASESYQMDIMIMLLMGGVPLKGGMKVRLSNAMLGCLTYNLISTTLIYCLVPGAYILLIKAIVFLVIVGLTCKQSGDYLPR